MGVDKSYGSGPVKKPVTAKAASAALRKGNIKKVSSAYGAKIAPAKMLPGTSDYAAQENAARKQLGVGGLNARNRQLPAAARATARGMLREFTGIDISRKGVSVDPIGLAMALPMGKVLKAAKALKAAGKIEQSTALFARLDAKGAGQVMGQFGNITQGVAQGRPSRRLSESIFPKLPSMAGIPGAKRSFDIYEDPLLEGADRFNRFRKLGKAAAAARNRGGR
jgi:hypothetical protein